MINIKDVDVIAFTVNNCCVKIISVEEAKEEYPSFSIDLKNGTWSLGKKTYDIGRSRFFHSQNSCCYGIIGAYDNTKKEQRNLMIHAAIEATKSSCICAD